jgi:hypothetical protein
MITSGWPGTLLQIVGAAVLVLVGVAGVFFSIVQLIEKGILALRGWRAYTRDATLRAENDRLKTENAALKKGETYR